MYRSLAAFVRIGAHFEVRHIGNANRMQREYVRIPYVVPMRYIASRLAKHIVMLTSAVRQQ